MKTTEIQSFDGTKLHTVFLPAEGQVRGTILWVHGAFEHIGRFADIMQHFAALGFNSIGYDARGHGNSGGVRCFIKSMDEYLRDLTAVYKHYASQAEGKLYLIGHSMGGLVAIRYRQEYPTEIPFTATILSSPFLGVKAEIPAWKKVLSKIVVNLVPTLAVPNDLDAKGVSHDNKVVEAYKNDPLVLKKATAGWFEEIVKNLAIAKAKAPQMTGELHVLYATSDLLVDPESTVLFYRALPASLTKSVVAFNGFYHEIFNELEKGKAYDAVYQILNRE